MSATATPTAPSTHPGDAPLPLIGIWAVFLAGTLGIAWSAIFVRLALPAPPLISAFYRILLGSALLGLWLALPRKRAAASPRAIRVALAAGVLFAGDMALWHMSLVETSVANATLLVNTTPVYIGLYSLVYLRQRLGGRFVVGAALALAGTAVLLGAKIGGVRGELLALAAGVFYSGYIVLMKGARGTLDAPTAVCIAGVSASLVLAASAWLKGDPFVGFPASSWTAMVAAAVVSQVVGVMGIAWALRYLRATYASVALLAQPVGTALLAWWILSEPITGAQLLGGVAVLAGIAVVTREA